jgi:hypothetical protein
MTPQEQYERGLAKANAARRARGESPLDMTTPARTVDAHASGWERAIALALEAQRRIDQQQVAGKFLVRR